MKLKINDDFEKKQLLNQIRMMLDSIEEYETIQTDAPVVSVSKNNINTNEVSEVITEMTGDITYEKNDTTLSTHNTPSVKHQNHGGRRPGSGRPKGYRLSEASKNQISNKNKESMKGNQNAIKNK